MLKEIKDRTNPEGCRAFFIHPIAREGDELNNLSSMEIISYSKESIRPGGFPWVKGLDVL